MTDRSAPSQDQWARWVLGARGRIDPERERSAQDQALRKVQQHFEIAEGEVVLDVGTGAGLIAFGALRRVGEQGKVIFSDISRELLDHCRSRAQEMGVLDRCQFLSAPADDLSALADASVDVVTLNAVLLYVAAKPRAFHEFYRVLNPNGRLYVAEPINRFGWPEPEPMFRGYDATPILEITRKVTAFYRCLQPPDTDPMFDFDEQDLLRLTEESGFSTIDLELQAHIEQKNLDGIRLGWENFWRGAGNPGIPPLEAAVKQTLTAEEAQRFVAYFRPRVETEPRAARSARALLWAVKG